jgi:TonB family protein
MRPTPVLGIAAAGAMLGAAAAPLKPESSHWAKRPTPAEEAQVRPASLPRGQTGYAAVRCKAAEDRSLTDCRVALDNPSGIGLSQWLLNTAPYYRLKPVSEGGEPPGADVLLIGDWLPFDKPPDWLKRPTEGDLEAVWPVEAWKKGEGGKAVITCIVTTQGALRDCLVTSESPAGAHFGEAAVALSPQLVFRPATLNGQPVPSPVNIPVNFVMPGSPGPQSTFGSRKTISPAIGWLEAPSYADVAAAYPKKAREAKLAGHATEFCDLRSDGRLTSCRTITEQPRGEGFADAARQLTKRFRAPTQTADGSKISEGSVQLPFTFDPAMLEGEQVIGKPLWATLPTSADTATAFGEVMKTVSGTVRVSLGCIVQPSGYVADCKVEREEPAGKGVGQAALALAPHFRVTTWTVEGLPTVGGKIVIPLRFEGGAPLPAPATKP